MSVNSSCKKRKKRKYNSWAKGNIIKPKKKSFLDKTDNSKKDEADDESKDDEEEEMDESAQDVDDSVRDVDSTSNTNMTVSELMLSTHFTLFMDILVFAYFQWLHYLWGCLIGFGKNNSHLRFALVIL